MGRNKIKIERKADSQQQSTIYNKRKHGTAKKTKELAILCDIDALLLSISPKGKIDLVLGPNSNLEDLIDMYAKLSSEERHEIRLENIKVLKQAYKGDPNHEVDVQKLMNHGVSGNSQAIEGQDEIPQSCLDYLGNIDNLPLINSLDELSHMEFVLEKLINLNRQKKMSVLEERARAIVFQQVAMNHPGPQNGNPMNQGTNLIQSNIAPTVPNVINCSTNSSNMLSDQTEKDLQNLSLRGPAGNSVTVSDPPMKAPELARNSDPLMAVLPKLYTVEELLILADECILGNGRAPRPAPKSDGNCVIVSNNPVAASPEKESITPVFRVEDLIDWDDEIFIDWD